MKAYVIVKDISIEGGYFFESEIMSVYLDEDLCRKQLGILDENNKDEDVMYFVNEFEVNQMCSEE